MPGVELIQTRRSNAAASTFPNPTGPSNARQRTDGNVDGHVVEGGEVAVSLVRVHHLIVVPLSGAFSSSSRLPCRSLQRESCTGRSDDQSATGITSAGSRPRRRRTRCSRRVARVTSRVRVCEMPGKFGRHHDDGAVLAQRPGHGEHDAVGQAPADGGQRDPPERLPAVGAQRRGGLFLLGRRSRAAPARPRGPRTAGSRTGWPAPCPGSPKITRKPERSRRRRTSPPTSPQQDQRNADDHRRDRERQVDDGLDDPAAAESSADQRQRGDTPKTTFSGTTIATISSDSCSAEIAAGVVIHSQNWPSRARNER